MRVFSLFQGRPLDWPIWHQKTQLKTTSDNVIKNMFYANTREQQETTNNERTKHNQT